MKPKTKKRLIALGLVLALLAGGAVGLRQLRNARRAETVAQAREIGMAAYDRGEWQAAMDNLGLYVHRAGRRDGEALFRLADARLREPMPDGSHYTTAIGILRDAIAADDPDERAAPMLLECYSVAGRWADVLALTEQMARGRGTDDPDRELILARVRAFQALGRPNDAIAEADRLVDAFPSDMSAHRTAIAARFRGSASREAAVRQYLDAEGGLGRLERPLAAETIRAWALLLIDDRDGALAACGPAVDAVDHGDVGEEVALLFDVLDTLLGFRPRTTPPEGWRSAFTLASELSERLLALDELSEATRVAIVSRNWRAGLRTGATELLAPVLSDPSAADASTLGWAIVADAVGPEAIGDLRAALSAKDDERGAFWLAIADTISALDSGSSGAAEAAAAAEQLASRIGGDAARERTLAAYLMGVAEAVEGREAKGEQILRAVGGQWGWRIARQEELRLILRRGDYLVADAAMDRYPGFGLTYAESILACEALVGLAEQRDSREEAGGAGRHDEAIARLTMMRDRFEEELDTSAPPTIEALLARAHAVNADRGATAAAVDALLAMLAEAEGRSEAAVRLAWATAARLRPRAPEQADRLLAFAVGVAPDDPDVLFQQALALQLAAPDENETASIALLEEALRDAEGDRAFQIRRRLATLLDARVDPFAPASERAAAMARAAEEFRALAEGAANDLDVQLDVLRSQSAWSDEQIVQPAIARVRALEGDDSTAWRIYEAKRLLVFAPVPGGPSREVRARTAITEVLAPVILAGQDAEALELAALAYDILGNGDDYIRMLTEAISKSSAPARLYPRVIAALREAGRPDEARAYLGRFLEEGDVGSVLSRDRATLLETYSMFDRAIAERERLAASGLDEDLLALARAYTLGGRRGEAGRVLGGLAATPDLSARVLEATANGLAEFGDVEGGRALLGRPGGFETDVERVLAVGRFLDRYGTRAEAIGHVRAFAESDAAGAERAAAWRWLARAHARSLDRDATAAATDAGLALEPGDEDLLAMRALLSSQESGDSINAALAAVASDAGQSEAMKALVDLLAGYAAGRVDQGRFLARLTEQTERWPTAVPTWGVLLQARAQAGDTSGVARDASRLMRAIDEPAAMELASRAFASIGQTASARSAAEQWRRQTPGNPVPADVQLATLDIGEGAFARALATLAPHLDAIFATDPPEPYASRAAAMAIVGAGSTPQRDRLARRAADDADWMIVSAEAGASVPEPVASGWLARLDAQNAEEPAALAVARAWVILAERSGEADHAARTVRIIGQRHWDDSRVGTARRLEASALRLLGRLDESEAAYRAALEASPSDWGAAGALAELLLESGRAREAVSEAARLRGQVMADPTAPALARRTSADLLARCQIAAGLIDDASRTISEARASEPGNPAIESRRMEIAALRGDAREVESAIRAIAADAGRIPAALSVADRLDESSPAAAVLVLEAAVRIAPSMSFEAVSAANNLAYLLVVTGGDTERAVELAFRASNDAAALSLPGPVRASVLETLGRAQLASGDAEEARGTFAGALGLEPGSADVLLGLAEALRALDRDAEADGVLARIDPGVREAFTESQRVRFERVSSAGGR
ncbi:MAG: tetratricopeptide repeat protein [Phycisphaerales bacterium]